MKRSWCLHAHRSSQIPKRKTLPYIYFTHNLSILQKYNNSTSLLYIDFDVWCFHLLCYTQSLSFFVQANPKEIFIYVSLSRWHIQNCNYTPPRCWRSSVWGLHIYIHTNKETEVASSQVDCSQIGARGDSIVWKFSLQRLLTCGNLCGIIM